MTKRKARKERNISDFTPSQALKAAVGILLEASCQLPVFKIKSVPIEVCLLEGLVFPPSISKHWDCPGPGNLR